MYSLGGGGGGEAGPGQLAPLQKNTMSFAQLNRAHSLDQDQVVCTWGRRSRRQQEVFEMEEQL